MLHTLQQKYTVEIQCMCRLFEISKSGYYKWLKKQNTIDTNKMEREIEIHKIFETNKGRYGSRRIRESLRQSGKIVNRKAIQSIMRKLDLRAKGTPKYKVTTDSKHTQTKSPNILQRQFNVTSPNKVWLSDITYLFTKQGWVYLSVILDCYSRRIVSWTLSSTMDKQIVIKPLLEATKREQIEDLVFHSDQGKQYASNEFRQLLNHFQIKQSMSRKGNCWDNAVAETFFKTLKREIGIKIFKTRKEAELKVFEYIETFYNTKRLHSSNNYLTPKQMNLNFYKKQNVS